MTQLANHPHGLNIFFKSPFHLSAGSLTHLAHRTHSAQHARAKHTHSTHSTAHTPPPLSERHLPGARRHASGHAGMQAADRGPQTAFCWKTPFCVTHSDCLHRTHLFTNSSFTLVCGRFTDPLNFEFERGPKAWRHAMIVDCNKLAARNSESVS